MYRFTKTIDVALPPEEVFKFSTNIYNVCLMVPDYINVKIFEGSESLVKGDPVKLKINIFGISFMWESVIEEYEKDVYFFDRMIKGPFKRWEHKHFFEKSEKGTLLTDQVDYELPLFGLGAVANKLFVNKMINGIFTFRHDYDMGGENKNFGCKV